MIQKHFFKKKLAQWYISFLKAMQLQLFISLVSLPFLISWGLSVSIMSIFSTLLLTPFLAAFLFMASLVFFSELLNIPNSFWIWSLETITAFWFTCLSIHKQWWLIGFTKPPTFCLIVIIPLALVILHSKYIKTLTMRTMALSLLFIIICIVLKFFPYHYPVKEVINYNDKNITLINYQNELIMIDSGALSSRPSFDSFIMYTLIPEITQKTGKSTITHLIIGKINKRTFDAIIFLSTKMTLKNIYIPWWTGKIPAFAWSSYKKLKTSIASSGGKIIPISKNRSLIKTNNGSLFIEVLNEKNIRYYDATYSILSVNGTLNDTVITI